MPYCPQCGTEHDVSAKFCSSCGRSLTREQNNGESFKQRFDGINNADGAADIEQNKAMAVLAYIGPLVLVPLLAAQNSKYARYHANQGLILLIASIIVSVATAIVFGILNIFFVLLHIWPIIAIINWLMGLALSGVFIAYMIIGIINAAEGRFKELPIIGKYRILN